MPPKKKGKKKATKKGAAGTKVLGISEAEALPPVMPSPRVQAMMFTVATSDARSLSSLVAHYNYREVLDKTDINGSTSLHLAARKNDIAMLRNLLGYPEVSTVIDKREMKCVGGYTALHHSCLAGNKDIVKLLIDSGADVNIQADSNLGETPLHICCKHGHIECAKHLVACGNIAVDARDNFGHNASFWAYSKRFEDMIRILNLPPVRSATAEEYLNIMLKRNANVFTLPSLKKGGKKKGDKKKGKKKK